MIIKLNKIASELKLKIPDLITRPVGKDLFARVLKNLVNIHEGEVLLLDFEGYRVLDPSFIDEFIIRLIFKSRAEENHFYVKLVQISEIAAINIASVFKSYNNVNNIRLAVITDSLIGNNYFIGDLQPQERDIINYLIVNKTALCPEIASFLEIGNGETEALLDSMHSMRTVRKLLDGNTTIYCSV